jgi:DNA polymerase-3 subunit alpha
MAFIEISDFTGSIETVAFPKTFEEFGEILQEESCVVIKGKVSDRNDEKSILIDKAKLLT